MLRGLGIAAIGVLVGAFAITGLFLRDDLATLRDRLRHEHLDSTIVRMDSIIVEKRPILQQAQIDYDKLADAIIRKTQDTTAVPRDSVKALVQAADSTIRTCNLILATCEQKAQAQEEKIQLLTTQLADEQNPWHLSANVQYGVCFTKQGPELCPSVGAGLSREFTLPSLLPWRW